MNSAVNLFYENRCTVGRNPSPRPAELMLNQQQNSLQDVRECKNSLEFRDAGWCQARTTHSLGLS